MGLLGLQGLALFPHCLALGQKGWNRTSGQGHKGVLGSERCGMTLGIEEVGVLGGEGTVQY